MTRVFSTYRLSGQFDLLRQPPKTCVFHDLSLGNGDELEVDVYKPERQTDSYRATCAAEFEEATPLLLSAFSIASLVYLHLKYPLSR
jgi:hypothetical protein